MSESSIIRETPFQYDAVQRGETYEESDYADHKLDASNKGYALLQKSGWQEGQGLGANQDGRLNPVNQ